MGVANTLPAAPFDLDSDSNRLPSTIANLVNFVFVVYNLALNCCCSDHFSLRFTLEQLTNQVGYNIIVIASTGCHGFMST